MKFNCPNLTCVFFHQKDFRKHLFISLNIPSPTKILTLVTAPFYCPLKKKRCTVHPEGTDVHI